MGDSEARKAATIKMAREFYEMMPGAEPVTINGEYHWPSIECTKNYNFCMLIASQIVAANCRVFK